MPDDQTYYKLVSIESDGSFGSVFMPRYRTDVYVQYKINEWTYSILPISKLFVFDDEQILRSFQAATFGWFKCSVLNPCVPEPSFAIPETHGKSSTLLEFWTQYLIAHRKSYSMPLWTPLPHTVLCDAVMLLERLQ